MDNPAQRTDPFASVKQKEFRCTAYRQVPFYHGPPHDEYPGRLVDIQPHQRTAGHRADWPV